MKKVLLLIIAMGLLLAGVLVFVRQPNEKTPSNESSPATETTVPSPQQTDTFDKKQYSTTDPNSIWVVVNKRLPLPDGFVPVDLTTIDVPLRLNATNEQMKIRKVAADDLKRLFDAAAAAGLQLEFGSGYRSYQYQRELYTGYVNSLGQAKADRSSARPGHSEHQTGLAIDFTRIDGTCHLEECFGEQPEGLWLKQNAHKYGFIIRYMKDKESVTGYMYEPWHYRYVGPELANEINRLGSGVTLEEFFGLPSSPDYL